MTSSEKLRAATVGAIALLVGCILGSPTASSMAAAQANAQAPSRPQIKEVLDPEHTLLLVHEVLNAFVSEGGLFDKYDMRIDVTGIMKPMVKVLAAARERSVRVAYVRWTTYPDGSTTDIRTRGPRSSAEADEPPSTIAMNEGTWGWENPEEITPEPNDWVLRKYRPDAFIATPLDELMRWNELTTLVVVGVGAEVGIVPTLATASSLGYNTVAIRDAIVPTDPHRAKDAMVYIGDHATLLDHTEVIDVWRDR